MTRTFTIKDAPNDYSFDRFVVTQDNGRPYLENWPVITTNDPVVLFRVLADWLKGECDPAPEDGTDTSRPNPIE